MANAQRVVMGGAFHYPLFNEFLCCGSKKASGVGVAGRRDCALFGNAFANDKLKRAAGGLGNAKHGDGAFLNFKFHRRAAAGFSVKFNQFGLALPKVAQCLADEVNYVDERYIKVID